MGNGLDPKLLLEFSQQRIGKAKCVNQIGFRVDPESLGAGSTLYE